MAHHITYPRILQQDIRHIYSGYGNRIPSRFHPEGRYHDFNMRRDDRDNLKSSYPRRLMEFRADYNCYIVKAFGFKCYNVNKVEEVVKRLTANRTESRSSKKRCTSRERNMKEEEEEEKASPRFLGSKKLSQEEMHESILRISQPTTMSILRERPPLGLSVMPVID